MSKNRFLLLFLVMFGNSLLSCHREKETPPVPPPKLAAVLLDLQLAESYSIGLGADSSSPRNKFEKNRDSLAVFYTGILAHHQLSFKQFNNAVAWYEQHPQEMDSLISEVIEALNKVKARNGISETPPQEESLQQPEQPRKDTLRKAPPALLKQSMTPRQQPVQKKDT